MRILVSCVISRKSSSACEISMRCLVNGHAIRMSSNEFPRVLRAGFTVVDVLALGAFGHAIGAGIILGLHNQGII